MKRTLCALLVTLIVSPLFDVAEAKPKRKQRVKETYGRAESGEPQRDTASVPRERKQVGGTPGDSKPGDDKKPTIGPPVERKLKKAKSRKFDLRKLPQTPPKQRERPEREPPELEPIELPNPDPASALSPLAMPQQPVFTAAAPAPILVFEGLDRQNWGSGSPPDTTGDVGPAYYIQAVNSSVGVYDKTDGSLEASFTFDTLMSQGDFGNQCDSENFGDPVVLYDTFEDRWILTDFAFTIDGGGNITPPVAYQCFAVSQNNDPVTGGWHFYSIELTDGLHDYEKLAVWTDGIYMSANMFGYPASSSFQLARVWAFNKAQMYAGSSNVQIVTFDIGNTDFTVVPSNARLQTGTPPAGRPNFFISTQNYLNAVGVYQFAVNWNNIPLSTFTGPSTPLAGSSRPSGGAAAVPQSGTAQTLDAVSIRAMVQHQYTNIGGVESLWIPHTVRRVTGGAAAPRWYQVNVTGGTVASPMLQSTTWDPDGNNTMNRWMPSLAIDRAGNMALAYSTSSTGTFPSIKYAGRLATDPVNTFSQTEQILFTGTASQTTSARWGDYSSVMLDPDGCTFWITNEYANPVSQDFDKRWKTKIGSFKYPECTVVGAGGTVTGTVTATAGGAPISGATVALGTRTATANGSGVYTFSNIPAGTYPSISASHPGYTTASASSIVVTDGGTTTQNFSLDTAATTACLTDTTQAHFLAGARTNVEVTTSPGDVKLARQVTLDQQSPIFLGSGTGSTAITTWFGQTFTPAISGTVARFDLTIFAQNCTPGTMPNITVAVRNATGNVPSGSDLATATIPGFCSGSALWYIATFATPAAVTAGTQYSIVWRLAAPLPGGSPAPIYFYGQSLNTGTAAQQNPYPGGRRAVSGDSGINWTGQPTNANNDHVFRVYIDSGYLASGNFISSTKDANPISPFTPIFSTLSWNGSTPANTTLRMQVAASNSELGPFTFVGPDGTSNTYFTTSPVTLSDQFYGFRYLQYKAFLDTASSSATPVLNDVTVCYQDLDCTGSGPSITPTPAQVCALSTGNTATANAGWFSYSWSITNGTITGGQNSQTVTYTAGSSGNVQLTVETRTQLHGCKKSANVNVAIVPVPATPTITPGGPTTFCTGGSVTLTSSSATNNEWLLNGNPISGETGQQYVATASGNYSVRVTENGCSATSAATTVTVHPIPDTPAPTNGGPYCEGQTIQLSTATVSGATYSWTGPNGFTSSDQNPTRSNAALADAGSYSVTVTVNGCTSAAGSTNVVVNPIPATPTASNGGPYCSGQTIQLSTPTVSGATYSWTGPNGFTSSDQNPTRANATTDDAGTYSVTVTVNGCTSAAGTTSVVVNATPATPTASNGGSYCEGATIQLSTPTVSGATYSWTGPNGFTSSDQNPTRSNATTADAGTYSVTVTVNGCTSAAGNTNVVVNATPATPTASNGGPYCEGATIQLNTPTVSGATYSWTGPNGFSSSDQNPTRANATLADAGTYSVTITVNGCTSAAGTTNVVVNAIPATPTASNGGPYCEGATIQLSTPTVSGATYSWTGPNGFASSDQNPTRANATLADNGTYSVTVTVNGCTSAAGSTNVIVNPIPATPTASNGGPYCEGQTIELSTPTVSGATYSWTGPNGFASSDQNPTRANATTADAGTYSVTITVNGCTSAAGSTNVVVNPIPAAPTASNGGPYCSGATIQLSTPTVSGATYSWTGPNGFTSSDQNPTRANATTADAGTYSVTVTVNGCTSAAGTTNVVVNETPATPSASNGGPYCVGATIQLNTPTVSGATYSWTGPNGFTSSDQNPTRANATTADAGTYSVTVTVNGCTSAAGTTNVVVNTVPATPTASNGGPYCEGQTIQLSTPTVSGATYSWTGPNGFTSSDQNPTRANATTADAGTYSVTVTVNGCTSAAGTTNVVVNATPATPTASNGGPYCEGATIQLSTPTVSGATYSWTGPNGFTSSDQNPTRANATTADAGTYSVTVTVNGCTSAAGTTNVVVNPIPATPTASNGGPYCEGQTIQLSTPTVSGATYSWTGPNGFTSSDQNPTRANATIADAGTYSVTVTVNGCTSAAGSTNVVVNTVPATPTASNGGPYCEGATIQLNTPTVSGATYSWTGPNSFTSSDQNPTRSNATTADAGTYSVTVTVNGCTSAAGTTNVVVNPIPATPTASNGGPYCEGATIQLSTPTVSGATYSWTGPNSFTSSDQNPTRSNATTADAGTYSVTVTVNGCTSAAGTTNVVVNPIPATPTASNGGPYCEGQTIQLSTPTVSGATYSWTGPSGFTSSDQNPTRPNATTADAGTYSVTITVNGCTSAAGTTNVVVNATPATPTPTNGGPYCEGATIQLSTGAVSGATYSWTGPNGFTSSDQNPTRSNATTADAGTYSVTVTVNGCTSAAGTTDVVVNPIPAAPTITPGGPTTFCAGGSVLLTSSSASGNQWYLNGNILDGATSQTFSAGASGDYTVTITSNGCTSAPSTAVTVTVNPIPSTPTITPGGATTFCIGGSVTLTSSSASGNQWYRDNALLPGENAQTLIATISGTYEVKVTANGCTSLASAPVIVTVNPKPDATITVASPMFAGSSSTASVNIACPGMTFSWGITGGTITSGNGTPVVTFTAGGAGTLTLTVTATNSFGCSDAKSANVTVNQAPFGAPPFLRATATGTTSASLLWAGVTDADHYEIYRSTDNINYVLQGTSSTTTFSQSGLTPSTTYLYKVKAIKADTTASAMSTADPATTMTFTNDPLTACPAVSVQAVHITQLRTAINLFRASVGLSAFAFTDPSLAAGAQIKGVHLTELRTALNGALSAIGVTPSYTDPTITGGVTMVKGRHMQELRDLLK